LDNWPAYDDNPLLGERLSELWSLGPAEVLCAVGGGGKTALIERLAREYEAVGQRVILTTTTRVLPPGPGGRPLLTTPDLSELLRRLARPPRLSPLVGAGLGDDGKLLPIPPDWAAALRDLAWVGAVLVEADGAARRPLKAPAPWEPVLPASASLVVAVAGLEAQGAALDAHSVHRPEILSDLLGLPLGEALAPQAVLEALLRGYPRSSLPAGARLLAYLNKTDRRRPEAALVDRAAGSETEVWAGSLHTGEFRALRPRDGRPAAVVLAAGLSRRMGRGKLSLSLGQRSLLGRVVSAVAERPEVAETIVVTGPDGGAAARSLAADSLRSGYRLVVNERPEEGQASSLRAGVEALSEPRDVLFLLADQPFVTGETVERLLRAAQARPRAAAVGLVAAAETRLCPPVLLHRSLLPSVLELRGDQGARGLLSRFESSSVRVQAQGSELVDVDTPADLERARRKVEGERS
jgi:molybdenum cofactor cytidylyltransferase